jgi:putative mRNA 3-end processing factor
MTAILPASWLKPLAQGLYCAPGDFFIDPVSSVDRAVVTHGHADHARPGNATVLASPATLAIMAARYGQAATLQTQALEPGEAIGIGGVTVSLHPAGHVLGSCQVRLEYRGQRIVVSGDYKRRRDPTCAAFEPIPCDVFITEATFGLPVFRHPPADKEVAKLLASVALFPERCHLVGVYALGKAQRVIALLREAGYDQTIFIHGALQSLCDLYRQWSVDLGSLEPATGVPPDRLKGAIVLAPPGQLADKWSRRFPDPLVAYASGWMRVRQRARQGGVELPLIISDHADWDELTETARDVGAPEIWVTHGREEALAHQLETMGIRARALALIGYEDEN